MNTVWKNFRLPLLFLGILFLTEACTKKCQPPATEKFQTFTGQQWRLVETNDPDPNFKNLSNTTFLIWQFGKDYTGSINKVLNNKLYDTPISTFEYNNNYDGDIRIKFSDPAGGAAPAGGSATQSTAKSDGSTVDYSYTLDREFTLNSTNGAYYRFVPYQGIVDPDNNCTF